MKIAQIAPLMESVPPRLYGGTERVVSYLTDELVHLGHDVTFVRERGFGFQGQASALCAKGVAVGRQCLRPNSLLHADARPRARARGRVRHPALPHRSVSLSTV